MNSDYPARLQSDAAKRLADLHREQAFDDLLLRLSLWMLIAALLIIAEKILLGAFFN